MAVDTLSRGVGAGDLSVPWWLVLLQSIAALIIGILLFTQTAATLYVLVVFLGVYWLISGILDLVSMFTNSHNWPWKLLSGILGIIAGVFIVRNPLWSTVLVPATLAWLLGAVGIIMGILAIIRGIAGGGWGPVLLGVLSLLLGMALFANLALTTGVLVVTAAILAVVGGACGIVMAFMMRRPGPAASRGVAPAPHAMAS
jgi:uncharacterized membrane protein HdeD (DUF308 family)